MSTEVKRKEGKDDKWALVEEQDKKDDAKKDEDKKGPPVTHEHLKAQLYLQSIINLRSLGIVNIADFQPLVEHAAKQLRSSVAKPSPGKIKMTMVPCGPSH